MIALLETVNLCGSSIIKVEGIFKKIFKSNLIILDRYNNCDF